jgi:hypothetical protein
LKAGFIAAASICPGAIVSSPNENDDEDGAKGCEEPCGHGRPQALPTCPVLREAMQSLVVLDRERAQAGETGEAGNKNRGAYHSAVSVDRILRVRALDTSGLGSLASGQSR